MTLKWLDINFQALNTENAEVAALAYRNARTASALYNLPHVAMAAESIFFLVVGKPSQSMYYRDLTSPRDSNILLLPHSALPIITLSLLNDRFQSSHAILRLSLLFMTTDPILRKP